LTYNLFECVTIAEGSTTASVAILNNNTSTLGVLDLQQKAALAVELYPALPANKTD
jgi:hypothetical protein